jgi:hypothetical protein
MVPINPGRTKVSSCDIGDKDRNGKMMVAKNLVVARLSGCDGFFFILHYISCAKMRSGKTAGRKSFFEAKNDFALNASICQLVEFDPDTGQKMAHSTPRSRIKCKC